MAAAGPTGNLPKKRREFGDHGGLSGDRLAILARGSRLEYNLSTRRIAAAANPRPDVLRTKKMSVDDTQPQVDKSLASARRIDKLCDEFEEHCRCRKIPQIEQYLEEVGEDERALLLGELLPLEIDFRRQAGEEPALDDYLARFGSFEPAVRAAFAESATRALPTAEPVEDDESPAADTLEPRYRVLESHAHGGLGRIWLAEDVELDRQVALKDMRRPLADDPQCRSRFVREAKITGQLEHPGIVPVYGLGCYENGHPFYAMKFVRGVTLKEAIDQFHAKTEPRREPRKKRLELRGLLGRFVEVCNAVAYAHSRGVLHRDLKPENIMLGEFGETLIVDWGLAKVLGADDEGEEEKLMPAAGDLQETAAGSAVGTLQYMCPEQAAGRHDELTAASDVYSLGATLYCVLVGQPAFPSTRNMAETLAQVRDGGFSPPRRLNSSVPAALDAVCVKAMSHAPQDRYASARELADDVENWLADEPVRAYPAPPQERLARWSRRHKSWVRGGLLAAMVVSALVIAGLVYWWRLPGTLIVSQAPPGARLQVAGQTYHVEGKRFDLELPAGAYQIQMSAPEHESATFEVLVERGKEKPLQRLRHDQGSLEAECNPLGSEIEVVGPVGGGLVYGSRIRNLPLDTGTYALRAWRDGHFESTLPKLSIKKNAATPAQLFLDEGLVWEHRSKDIQSMAIPIRNAAGEIAAIVHDEVDRVVARSPRDGTILWTLPFDSSQRFTGLFDLSGETGPVLVVAHEAATKNGMPANVRVDAVRPIQSAKDSNSELKYAWRWQKDATQPWTTVRGLSVVAVSDLNDDGVREIAAVGRDATLYVIDGRGGKTLDSIELLKRTAQETPALYLLDGPSAKLIGYRIEPGPPDNDRQPYPKPLVVGCVDVDKRTVLWTRALKRVMRTAIVDVDGDGTREIYWRNREQWQMLDGLTGNPRDRDDPWPVAGEQLSSSPWFADVDGDGRCEIIELPKDNRRPIVARRVGNNEMVWEGPSGSKSIQPHGRDGQLLRAPHGELLIFCQSSLIALDPATGKQAWSIDGAPEDILVVGQWDNLGEDEVFVGIKGRGIVCLAADGSTKWTLRMSRDVRPLTILPDVDGDGLNELVINKHAAFLGVARGPRVLWRRQASGPLLASPQVVDFDGDGQVEVCQVGHWGGDTHCRCFEGRNGAVRWSINERFPNNRAQAVCDWDGDAKHQLDYVLLGEAAGTKEQTLYTFRGMDGRALTGPQRLDKPNALYSNLGIGDFNGDGHADVAAVRWDRRDIVAIDGKRGEIYWRFKTNAENHSGVAVGDLDGDCQDDVVATASYRRASDSQEIQQQPIHGTLIALPGRKAEKNRKNAKQQEPRPFWIREVGLPIRSIPYLFDLDGDGALEVLAVSQVTATGDGDPPRSRLNVLSRDGKRLWAPLAVEKRRSKQDVPVLGRPAAARVDGGVWIVAPLGNDGVVTFDYGNKKQAWQSEAGVRVVSTPVIDDLDGDGTREVVATTVDGELLVLDLRTGTRLWQLKLSDNRISGGAGIGDLNRDGVKDIVVADEGFTLTAVSGLSTKAGRARRLVGSNSSPRTKEP